MSNEENNARLEALAQQLMRKLHAAERELHENKRKLKEKSTALDAAKARLKEIESSRWWKLGKPFRKRASVRKSDANSAPEKAAFSSEKIGPLEFPAHAEVAISVVIPVHNQFAHTQRCLWSLLQHGGAHRFEVIVVDDGSTDETAQLPQKAKGVVYLRNEKNLGFIGTCNRGAEAARGEFITFLNNDTTVTPGWLDALLETFQFAPEAGLVGAKLVYPDGKLQEAGGVVFNDGSAANLGKGGDPDDPCFNFLREVDYCSAACVMIRREVFREVGGFDARFAPCYYEDTDLAFKVKQSGRRVLYQPFCKIIHFEGATAGKDISAGPKKHQETNRLVFFEKWTQRLSSQPPRGSEPMRSGTKILVIDDHVPMPDRHAGGLRMLHLLLILHEQGHAVTFIPGDLKKLPGYIEPLQKRGIEILYEPYLKSVEEYLQKQGAALDLVILSRLKNVRKFLEPVRKHAPRAKVIFDTVDLYFLRNLREAELLGDAAARAEAELMRAEEMFAMESSDETWVVSTAEKELLAKEKPNMKMEIVTTILEIPGCAKPFSTRRDLLFIGGFRHKPNVDAVIWFATEVFPLARAKLPGVKFHIIGGDAPESVAALASENIVVAGHRPDITADFENVKLSVAPLRFGAGVKGKINLSMSYGVPVVATSIAAEGMGLTPGEDVLVADDPPRFAAAVVELYISENLWQRLSTNGLETTKKHYSVETMQRRLAALIPQRA